MIIINTYYLIDYENVHSDGLHGYEQLDSTDHVNIFFTRNGTTLDMSIISNGSAEIKMTEVPAGDQSADMHICSYIGYLAGINSVKKEQCTVIIVSNDTDYDNVINFWNKIGDIKATRTSHIRAQKPKPKKESLKPDTKTAKDKSKTGNSSNNSIKTADKSQSNAAVPAVKASGASTPAVSTESEMNALIEDIKVTLNTARYKDDDIKTIAMLAIAYLGDKDMLSKFHNELTKRYKNYADIYKLVKPVLNKYIPSKKKPAKADPKKELSDKIIKILHDANYSKDVAAFVNDTVIANYASKNRKQDIYQTIIYKYGTERGLKIYNRIKKSL